MKSATHYAETALDEIKLLRCVSIFVMPFFSCNNWESKLKIKLLIEKYCKIIKCGFYFHIISKNFALKSFYEYVLCKESLGSV